MVFLDRDYVTLGVKTNAQLHTRFGWDRGYDIYYDSEQVNANAPVGDFERRDRTNEGDGDDAGTFLDRKLETLKSEAY